MSATPSSTGPATVITLNEMEVSSFGIMIVTSPHNIDGDRGQIQSAASGLSHSATLHDSDARYGARCCPGTRRVTDQDIPDMLG